MEHQHGNFAERASEYEAGSPVAGSARPVKMADQHADAATPAITRQNLIRTVSRVSQVALKLLRRRSLQQSNEEDTSPVQTAHPGRPCSKREQRKHEEAKKKFETMLTDLSQVEDLEAAIECMIPYKETWLKGRLLHYAIWKSCVELKESDAALVKSVLKAKANVRGTAEYTKREKTNVLEAVHLASGLGSVPALQVLTAESENPVDIVNAECKLDGKPFYRPIHDAAYIGRKDSLVWLLENGADPSALNIDDKSALSFIALNGFKNEGDLEIVVRSLLEHRARLDLRTKHNPDRPGDVHGNKLCLELAAGSDSQYPRPLLHLLMPSMQGSHRESSSVFRDLCDVASLNTDAANQLAKQLMGDADKVKRVQLDAQRKNAVDSLARLFHMAPEAAAELLGVMMHRPMVQDPGHHAIPTRTTLWGFFGARQMRCEYQHANKESGGLRVPLWEYDNRDAKRQKPPWHESLVPVPGIEEEQGEYVADVETMAVLLPNILDIDILMALAYTSDDSSDIFDRVAVQGIITCLWDQLMAPVFFTRLLFNLIDIFVMASWGLSRFSADEDNEETNSAVHSPVQSPRLYSIVMAGLLRASVHLIMWIWSHYRKWRGHFNTFQSWERGHRASHRPPGLHSLWRPRKFFAINNRAMLDLLIVVLKAFFVISVSDQAERAMTPAEKALLTTLAIVQCHKLMYMLRLSEAGKHVSTIISACCSAAIRDMMFVTLMFYSCALLALTMLKPKSTVQSSGLQLYLGLLFGDGDALKFMGLEAVTGSNMRSSLMLGATLVFHIVILNLTTAVYSNEYDRLQKQEENTFLRERSKCCTELLLSTRLQPSPPGIDTTADAPETTADARFTAETETTADAHVPARTAGATADAAERMKIGLALAVGAAAVLWSIPCGSMMGLACRMALFASACSLAFAMVSIQACLVASHWFPERDDGGEGPYQEHFLWIVYRAKRKEDQDVDAGQVEVELKNRLGSLERTMNEQVVKLGHLGTHASNVDRKLDDMAKKMEQLLEIAASLRSGTQT